MSEVTKNTIDFGLKYKVKDIGLGRLGSQRNQFSRS